MDKSVWKETVRKNANKKSMGSCNRCEGGVHTTKRKDIPFVKRGKRGSKIIYKGAAEERIHLAVEITTNSAGVLCRKEKWEEKDSTEL